MSVAPVISRWTPGIAAWILEKLFTLPLGRPMSERQTAWMDAAVRSRVRFDADRELTLYTWGSTGPTVLLVHGWSGRASQLGLYAAPLLAAGYRVVAFDGPGHGESDGRFSSLPEFADAVERVATLIGTPAAIVAHSLGSAATTLALSRGVTAERVVYLAPPEDLPGYLSRLAGTIGFSQGVADGARARIEARYGVPMASACGAVLAPHLSTPMRAFHDAEDAEVPHSEGARLVEAWPGAELITTQGLGHHRIVWNPEVVAGVVAFIADGRTALRPTG